MIIELYRNVCKGISVRENLIGIKNEMKTQEQKLALKYELAGDFSAFLMLLRAEDPKIRKNAALILGGLESEELMPLLYEAYENEEKRFIRGDYLKAIQHYDYSGILESLKEKLVSLRNEAVEETSAKHVREETALLQSMILKYEKPQKHKFTGWDLPTDIILLTNRSHREVTARQICQGTQKMLAGGVRIEKGNLHEIFPIRTYQEMLFPIKGVPLLKGTPQEMADMLKSSGLYSFLEERHTGKAPFYFRIELKSKMGLEEKGPFIRKFSAQIEECFNEKLLNSTSEYEVEIRIIENKEGAFIPLLKLYTIQDKRFMYRKESLSTSISPVNAALIMELVQVYLKEEGQILDPFCGVGTMLIERNKKVKAKPIYGLDILDEAVMKARANSKRADMLINYIQRDFFDFRHDYLFDEIITNMPGISKTRNHEELQELYENFLDKSREILKEDGCIILYSDKRAILMKSLNKQSYFTLVKEIVILDREGSAVYVLIPGKD